jgi:hypothetical protein
MNSDFKPSTKTSPKASRFDAPSPGPIDSALDRILSSDEQLVPSSGFVSAVMERVHEEAAAPPPIPFPWKRMLPGFAFAAGVFGWGAYQMAHYLPQIMRQIAFAAPHLPVPQTRELAQAGWLAVACALSFFSWWFSNRLTRRSGAL